jgi:hypothetical protein
VVVVLVTVVLVSEVVVVVLVEVEPSGSVVVVVPAHGHASATSWPSARFRQSSASLAVVGSEPLGAHMHAGAHVSEPSAARRM